MVRTKPTVGPGVALAVVLALVPFLVACTSGTGAGKTGAAGATTSPETSSPSTTLPRPVPPAPVVLSAAAGETALPPGLVGGGRFSRGVVVDGGRLVVEPAPANVLPVVGLARARALVGAAQSGEGDGWGPAQLIGFGIVSIDPALTSGLPAYARRAAWVALLAPSPAVRFADDAKPQASFEVIVLDAGSGGAVLVYRSRGLAQCHGPSSCTPELGGPSVAAASEIVSIPWTAAGQRPDPYNSGRVDWLVSYTIPRCAVVFDSPGVYWPSGEGGPPALFVDVEEPMDQSLSCSPSRSVTSAVGPESTPVTQVRHAPVGTGISSA